MASAKDGDGGWVRSLLPLDGLFRGCAAMLLASAAWSGRLLIVLRPTVRRSRLAWIVAVLLAVLACQWVATFSLADELGPASAAWSAALLCALGVALTGVLGAVESGAGRRR